MTKGSALAASWLAVGAVVVLAVSALAQMNLTPRILHVDKLTCAELLALPRESNDRIVIFFDGYIAGLRKRKVWDERAEGEMIDRDVGYCKADPKATVLSAFTRAAKP